MVHKWFLLFSSCWLFCEHPLWSLPWGCGFYFALFLFINAVISLGRAPLPSFPLQPQKRPFDPRSAPASWCECCQLTPGCYCVCVGTEAAQGVLPSHRQLLAAPAAALVLLSPALVFQARLCLFRAARSVLGSGMQLLGITPVTRM